MCGCLLLPLKIAFVIVKLFFCLFLFFLGILFFPLLVLAGAVYLIKTLFC